MDTKETSTANNQVPIQLSTGQTRMSVLRALRCFHRWNEAIAAAIVAGVSCTVLLVPQIAMAQNVAPRQSIVTPIDETQLTTLRGNTHPLARPQYDRGLAADSQPLRRMLLLLRRSPEQEQALRKLLEDQQSAASVNFHQWLTPQQFGQQFGPADVDVRTVAGWLGTHGFSVAHVSPGKTVIEFSGTAGQVRSTFHTEIHRYVVDGKDRLANASDPQIPEALADVVAGPVSLNNFPSQQLSHVVGTFRKNTVTGKVDPLFTFSTSDCATPCNAVGPGDFAKIYDVMKLWNPASGPALDGTGQTIAIVGESEIATSDVTTFRSIFGLPPNTPNIIVDGPDPGYTSAQTEGTIDVEWAGAVAKNATIDFVIDEPTEVSHGFDLAAEYVVDNNLAPVVSESFGVCEFGLGNSGNQFEYSLWEQASAQGITPVVASGDTGSAVCDNRDLSSPNAAQYGTFVSGVASTPFDVAAGGTDFDITAANYQSTYWNGASSSIDGIGFVSATGYIPETTWNNTCAQSFSGSTLGCSPPPSTDSVNIVAGSGGQSRCTGQNGVGQCSSFYAKPPWQPIAAGSDLTTVTDVSRDVPDISLFWPSTRPATASTYSARRLRCRATARFRLIRSIFWLSAARHSRLQRSQASWHWSIRTSRSIIPTSRRAKATRTTSSIIWQRIKAH